MLNNILNRIVLCATGTFIGQNQFVLNEETFNDATVAYCFCWFFNIPDFFFVFYFFMHEQNVWNIGKKEQS